MKAFPSLAAGAVTLLLPACAMADAVNPIDYFTMTGNQTVTFDDIPGGFVNNFTGVAYNNLIVSGGVQFGERFTGQTLSYSNNFDVLSGTPTGPLSVVAGAPGQNLNVFQEFSSNVLAGDGPIGAPNDDSIGEGSIAILFSADESQFGFALLGGNNGNALVSFYGDDGSLIDAITLTDLTTSAYAFQTAGGVTEVRGVTITNSDPFGIALDTLKFDVASNVGAGGVVGVGGVPEPAAWALMLVGFGGAGAMLRRSRRRQAWA